MSISFDFDADFRVSVAPMRDGVRTATLVGDLDRCTAEPARSRLAELLPDARVLALDAADVRFCDAAGLRLLTRLHVQGQGCGCRVVISAASPMVDWLLRLTELAAVFDYPPDPAT